jgi:hypothetical protein
MIAIIKRPPFCGFKEWAFLDRVHPVWVIPGRELEGVVLERNDLDCSGPGMLALATGLERIDLRGPVAGRPTFFASPANSPMVGRQANVGMDLAAADRADMRCNWVVNVI